MRCDSSRQALRDASSWLELHRGGLWEAKFEAVEQHLRTEEETMSQTEQETVLQLEHRFAAPRERLFDAFVTRDVHPRR